MARLAKRLTGSMWSACEVWDVTTTAQATAVEAVADQSLQLEVSASGSISVREDKRSLPFVIFQLGLAAVRSIGLWGRREVRPGHILEPRQSTLLVNAKGVPETVLAEAFGSRYVFLPTYRLHRHPISLVVQCPGNFGIVVGNLEVVAQPRMTADACSRRTETLSCEGR